MDQRDQASTRSPAAGLVLFGMSIENGYYRKKNIIRALKQVLLSLPPDWIVYPCVPSRPALLTFIARGYTEIRAQKRVRKATKQYRRHALEAADGDDRYTDCDWDFLTGGDKHPRYVEAKMFYEAQYNTNKRFREDLDRCVVGVSENQGEVTEDILNAGRQYLMSELACLRALRERFGISKVVLVYHKPFPLMTNVFRGTPYGMPSQEHISLLIVNGECEKIGERDAYMGSSVWAVGEICGATKPLG